MADEQYKDEGVFLKRGPAGDYRHITKYIDDNVATIGGEKVKFIKETIAGMNIQQAIQHQIDKDAKKQPAIKSDWVELPDPPGTADEPSAEQSTMIGDIAGGVASGLSGIAGGVAQGGLDIAGGIAGGVVSQLPTASQVGGAIGSAGAQAVGAVAGAALSAGVAGVGGLYNMVAAPQPEMEPDSPSSFST